MGQRGPKIGATADKVLRSVPVRSKTGKIFYQNKHVSAETAHMYGPPVEQSEEEKEKKKVQSDKVRSYQDKEVLTDLPPNEPERLHSHHGALDYHPVHIQHPDTDTDIEHRDEMDQYERKYYGSTMQPTRQDQLGIKLDNVVKLNIPSRNAHVMARKYTQPQVGDFYLFEFHGVDYVSAPKLKILKHFGSKGDGISFIENYVDTQLSSESKSLILKRINDITDLPGPIGPLGPTKHIDAFASYTSGNNSVRLEYDGKTYSILVNDAPVYQSGEFGSAMSEYYRQIGEIVRIQESDPDIALNIFGNQVVRTNRSAIEKLSMMGKSLEAGLLKNFDYSELELPFTKALLMKFEPPSNQLGQVPVMEDQGQAANELGVKPRRFELREKRRIGPNTIEMKSLKKVGKDEAKLIGEKIGVDFSKYDLDQFVRGINVEQEHGSEDPQTDIIGDDLSMAGKIVLAHLKEVPNYYTKLEMVEKELKDLGMMPAPEEAKQDRHRSIERPYKVGKTYQQKNSPSEEAPIVQKDFPKQAEGEMVHELVGLEAKDKIGQKPRPIIGKSFSPMMATDRIGSRPKPIEGADGFGSFSTDETQTTAEENNQMKELSNYGDVIHNRKPFFDMIKAELIYDQVEDILKSASLVEGLQPIGVKKLGNEVEYNVYQGLRDTVNNWFSRVEKSTDMNKAIIDLKADLMKWQIGVNKDVTEDVKTIFNKGVEAGIRNTGVAVPDRLMGTFNYQLYKPTGISPALENFQNEIFSKVSNILRKHCTGDGIPLYSIKKDIDSYLRKARYKTRLMLKSEVAQMANLGQLIAWDQDPDKYKYEYNWNAVQDDRIKKISKMRAEGNPYSFTEADYLWKNQEQLIDGSWCNDTFSQRCSISRGARIDQEWKDNRFSTQTNMFKSTMV